MITTPSYSVLVVEDNDDDFESVEDAFAASGFPNLQLHRFEDGQSAMAYLKNLDDESGDSKSSLPDLILLDLNLPGINGRRILSQVKNSQVLKSLPVIIFTTSEDKEDINKCYALGANGYIQKPGDLEQLNHTIQILKEYWFNVSALPKDVLHV